jgi:diguanylate cyclase (GGDEF)-like protein
MLPYLKNSFYRLKQDVLSKALYDMIKYIIGGVIILIIAKLISPNTSLESVINVRINLTLLNFFLILIFAIVLTLFFAILYTRRKYVTIEKDNFTDELTGLNNHKALRDILPKTIEYCRKNNQKLSLIIIDIDNFKQFNKDYNYQIADKVLRKVGDLLKSDSRVTDISFRQYFKSDEFIIIAKETDLANAVRAANRKRELFKTGFEIDNTTYRLTVSGGVTEFNFAFDNQEEVLARLSKALQIAKGRVGKNCVESLI